MQQVLGKKKTHQAPPVGRYLCSSHWNQYTGLPSQERQKPEIADPETC